MTINIIGLGKSLHDYNGKGISIGVNDVYRYFKTDYLVCVDKPDRFNPERRAIIENSNPIMFFSNLKDWQHKPNFILMTLSKIRGDLSEIKTSYPFGTSSSFCAACIGVKLGASELRLYGVDMNDHPNIKDAVRDAEVERFRKLSRIVRIKTTKESYLSKYFDIL